MNGKKVMGCLMGLALAAGCAKFGMEKKPELPVILQIEGKDIYLDELELLGRVALEKANLLFDSEAGQQRYHEIAPNLYDTLIDLYVIKFSADAEEVTPSPEEVDEELAKFKSKLSEVGKLDTFMTSLGVDEARLRELMQARLAMEKLQQVKLEEGVRDPTDEEIKNYYYPHHAQFRFPQRVRVSHIFFKAGKDEDQALRRTARKRAEQVEKMIGDSPGQTFIRLAQRYSEDAGNAPRGGDIGFITRDASNIPESFKQAAFALDVGGVSGVVETDLGYHLIWVTDHEESLEEAREEIVSFLRRQSMAAHFVQWKNEARMKMSIVRCFDPETFTVLPPEQWKKDGE